MLVFQWDLTDLLLPNGKVLVIDSGGVSAELYDPATGKWSATAGLSGFRVHYSATLLSNGKVLVAGGWDNDYMTSAELYDPATETWTPTGSMDHPREYHSATLLADGRVLVAGGIDAFGSVTPTAELYDPVTGAWTKTSPLRTARYTPVSTLLPNQMVLVVNISADGQRFAGGKHCQCGVPQTSAPAARNIERVRVGPGSGGRVVQLGGGQLRSMRCVSADEGPINGNLASAELFDPASGTWTLTTPMPAPRSEHTATLLPDGRVLIAGGADGTNQLATARAELFDMGFNTATDGQPGSTPVLWLNAGRAGKPAVTFAGLPGQTLAILRSSAPEGPWTNIATITVPGSGLASFADFNPPLDGAFYRTSR